MRIISNTNKPNDRLKFILQNQGKNSKIYIASAFFSDAELLLNMIKNDCTIMLIVRLDIGTDPKALKQLLNNPKIDIRFYTGRYFHPKIYIFENRMAYVGSANCTTPGLMYNNEIVIEFDSEEMIFDELKYIFYDYWNHAEVLTESYLDKFSKIERKCTKNEIFREINKEIGVYEYNNVGRDKPRGKKEKFISEFRKSYQLYISKFNSLKKIYEKTEPRRYPDVPLRIEVDRFLWWIREFFATGESYINVPEKTIAEIEKKVIPLINEFKHTENKYLDSSARERFLLISNTFSTKEKISSMNFDTIFDTLTNVYAFHDTLRFQNGGLLGLKDFFQKENPLDKIKQTIVYLIYGNDDYEERIFNCCYSDKYKLKGFGESCLKELYGLINKKDIPICNGRTIKSMEWLGFGKL